jgi:hypothetical protein
VKRYASMRNRRARTPTPGSSGRDAEEALSVFMLHFLLAPADHVGLGHEDDVYGRREKLPVATEALAKKPLRAVAVHRASHASAGGDAEPRSAPVVVGRDQEEQRTIESQSVPEESAKLRAGGDPIPALQPGSAGTRLAEVVQAPSLFRPL